MTNRTTSEECETFYNKLNSFVKRVINRDVTPKLSNLNTEVWGSNTQTGSSRIDTLESDVTSLSDSITNHTHDNRYYTEAEVRSLINQSIKIVTASIDLGLLSANGGETTKTATITIPSGYSVLTVFPRTWYGCDSFSILSISGSTITVKAFNLTEHQHNSWVSLCVICIKNG